MTILDDEQGKQCNIPFFYCYSLSISDSVKSSRYLKDIYLLDIINLCFSCNDSFLLPKEENLAILLYIK